MDVALVTCRELPEPDPDAAPLTAALATAGITAALVSWDDAGVDWSRPRLTVLRSCWNYPLHREAFVAWAEHAHRVSRLWNPLPVVRWNSHKGYLLELAGRCCEEGIGRLDLGRGDERYKSSMASASLPIAEGRVTARSLRGRALAGLVSARERIRDWPGVAQVATWTRSTREAGRFR